MDLATSRWRFWSMLWLFLLTSGGVVVNLKTILIPSKNSTFRDVKAFLPTQAKSVKGYFIKTTGCTIPEMQPMDESIKEFIFDEKRVECNNGIPPLMASNLTALYIIESALVHYNIRDKNLLKCCFQPFHRVNPKDNKQDNFVEYDKTCNEFRDSVDINKEFIMVKCSYNKTNIYKDYFAFVPLKNNKTNTSEPNKQKLNVLLLGLDAVSRLNLQRRMPKTVKYLKELQAIELLGYTKVGDNTFPNLIPVLTGLTVNELTEKCWPKTNSYFDKCPFIWKKYSEAGYNTVFGEDSAWMGLFYYTRKGFQSQPTDYFWDHFDFEAERKIGNNHKINVDQCIGARPGHTVMIDYIKKFTTTMHLSNESYFGFFWSSSLTHDFLNKPKLGDSDYFELLYSLNQTGILNNTVLIILSDHGIRWGDIRSTYQGRMEERLPFVYIRLPDWYSNQFPLLQSNLKINERRLTTAFDLYETLKDLINIDALSSDFLNRRKNNNTSIKIGYSLFDQIPAIRTCATAGIPAEWCTCQNTQKININNDIVKEAANFTVREINDQLIAYTDCAILALDEIINASLQTNNKEIMEQNYSCEDYTVTLKTKPGGALFVATVRKYVTKEKGYNFNLTGTISRINVYGDQSRCMNMTDSYLKFYCFCK